ncbi:CHAT domain-containing protein [Streptomyces litchfieldiae]|uniref:CHAT domain-containing protein n=1 Tax=Streptomyces litchfieldiae TaxID=3075543 RepID=A0ABU2MKD2_9ACTN|nr:CHAT domain-containing protein [Streptomyces sp. DSM 44938]MDT0341980.1 CHAT domain-containing protein [Streptomyces sp. DSM 44938]
MTTIARLLDVRGNQQGPYTDLTYELRSGSGALETEDNSRVTPTLIHDWCASIDKLLNQAADDGGHPEHELADRGAIVYEHLFPFSGGQRPSLVGRLREITGPLLVRENKAAESIPWELLHDGRDFLGLTHELGRRPAIPDKQVTGRAAGTPRRALLVGDTLGDLPAARDELERLAAWLDERDIKAKVLTGADAGAADVIRELAAVREPYDLFHFCGHAATGAGTAGLVMYQRDLLDLNGLRTLSARGTPPVVFINGCASAGRATGLAQAFMAMGSQLVVGTRAEVADGGAWRFAEEFYGRLLRGVCAGAAVRGARARLREESIAAWAAFLLYGDPATRLTGEAPDPTLDMTPRSGPGENLTPDAAALMALVRKDAAPRGIVTSIDLLLGLLGEKERRQRVEKDIGTAQLATITEVLRMVVEVGLGGSPDGEVELSGTVTRVLVEAEGRALGDGRLAVTTNDIAEAFVELGGGISAQLLEIYRIPLERLLLPRDAGNDAPNDPVHDAVNGPVNGAVNGEPRRPPANVDNGNGKLRVDTFSRDAANALRLARLIAKGNGEIIGSHTLLLAFGALDSETLRRGLADQGAAGERALQQLTNMLVPRPRELSPRVRKALETLRHEATADEAGGVVSETALLAALLADEKSGAHAMLRKLGVDPARLSQFLDQEGGREGRPPED